MPLDAAGRKLTLVSADGVITERLVCLRSVIVLTAGTSIRVYFGNSTGASSSVTLPTATAGQEYLGLDGIICKGLYADINSGTYAVVYDEL